MTKDSVEKLRAERTRARLAELQRWIAFHKQRIQVAPDSAGPAAVALEHAATAADAALAAANEQERWGHVHQGFRLLLTAMPPAELQAHREALRREVNSKLREWRKDAALDLLGREPKDPTPVPVEAISTAQFLLDQHFDNVYFKLSALGLRMRGLSWIVATGAIMVFATSVLLARAWPGASDSVLFDPIRTGLVLLLGSVGAMLSNAASVAGMAVRIPQMLGELAGWRLRASLGGLGGLAVVVLAQSGLLPLAPLTDLAMFGLALAGGFSDQLLNRMLASVEKSLDK